MTRTEFERLAHRAVWGENIDSEFRKLSDDEKEYFRQNYQAYEDSLRIARYTPMNGGAQ